MTRQEYITRRSQPTKEFPFRRPEGRQNVVHDLGHNLGQYVVANKDDDEAEYPDEQQGVIIRTRKHKTGDKMEAITFLSLVNSMLMDAYYTITRRFVGEEAWKLEDPLFINSRGCLYSYWNCRKPT